MEYATPGFTAPAPRLTFDGVDSAIGPTEDEFITGDNNPLPPELVGLIHSFQPSDDSDGDGIGDDVDNCPFQSNVSQRNRGGFLVAVEKIETAAAEFLRNSGLKHTHGPGLFLQLRHPGRGQLYGIRIFVLFKRNDFVLDELPHRIQYHRKLI